MKDWGWREYGGDQIKKIIKLLFEGRKGVFKEHFRRFEMYPQLFHYSHSPPNPLSKSVTKNIIQGLLKHQHHSQ